MADTPRTTPPRPREVVMLNLQAFVEDEDRQSDRARVAFYDARGERLTVVVRRKWITRQQERANAAR